MIQQIINQIIDKVSIILILSLILQGLKYNGILNYLLKPLNKIKNIKFAIIFWFLFGALLSSFSADLNAAAMLCPLMVFYCEQHNIRNNREILLLSGILGIATGGDLTKYGGGDNILLSGLFEMHFNEPLLNSIWFKYITPPTILIMIFTIFIILHFIDNENIQNSNNIINYKFNIFSSFLLFLSLILMFNGKNLLSLILLLIGLIVIKTDENILKNIPLKAINIWTIAFIIGKIIGVFLNSFIDFSNINLSNNFLLIVFVLLGFILTSITTQTFVTSCLMEIIFSIFGQNYAVLMLMIKSINSSYLTILSDGCFPVGQSYGINQKTLFKIGSILLIPQIIVPIIWYFILI